MTVEAEFFIDFTDQGNKLCLSLYYNWSNSYLLLNGVKINQFKAKDSELNDWPRCLINILKDFSDDNMKQTGLNVYAYDFSVDYGSIDVYDILDSHEYLMNQNNVKMFQLIKKIIIALLSINGSTVSMALLL